MRVPEKIMEQRMLAVLLLFEQCKSAVLPIAGPGRPAGLNRGAPLSLSALSRRLGLTKGQVRCVLQRLVTGGFVMVFARYQTNGGQMENVYVTTDAGRAFLCERMANAGDGNAAEVACASPAS